MKMRASIVFFVTPTVALLQTPVVAGRGRRKVGQCVAPSGIDGLPLVQQAAVFAGIYAGLGASTAGLTKVVTSLDLKWRKSWPLLGGIYAFIGAAHFLVPGAFEAIFPASGTWGFWHLPGSPAFHVAWTGVAEILGGTGLLLGAALGNSNLRRSSAFALALLTLAVTPANIYMYTHGAIMVGAGPDGPLPLDFHYIRFALQVILLTILTSEALRQD